MGAIPANVRPAWSNRPSEGPPLPEPGLWEQATAGARVEADRVRNVEQMRKVQAYEALADALEPFGLTKDTLMTRTSVPLLGPMASGELDYARIFREARRRGLKGPDGSALPDTPEEFEQRALRRYGGRDADQAVLARGHGVGAFAAQLGGAAVGSLADPVNIASFGFGGVRAGGLVAKLVTEGAANATVEAAQAATVNRQGYANLGEDYGIGQAAGDIAAAFVGGVALRGGFELAPKALSTARGGFERVVAANWERLPQGVRERWSGELPQVGTPEHDLLVADTSEAIAGGRDNLAEHEAAAIDVARREAEIDLVSPLRPNGAAAALHPELLGEAMRRIMATVPEAPAPLAAPRARPTFRTSTAISGGTVAGDAQARFMQRVRRAESSGDDVARNPRSTATGRYQFIGSTWLHYYKRRYGSGGLSDSAILAKRSDGGVQDQLMADLTADNAAFLRARGEAVSEGNLYLVHFAGQGGARKLLEADPGASAAAVLGKAVVDANPHLRGMTAQGVIDWAHRAVGAEPGRRAGAGAQVRPEASRADELQAEIAAIETRMDALRTAREEPDVSLLAERPAIDAEPPPPIDVPELQARDISLPEGPASGPEAPLPALRAIVNGSERKLTDIDGIAAELGVDAQAVRRGLTTLAQGGELRMVQRFADRERVKNAQGKWRTKSPAEIAAANDGVWKGTFARRATPSGPEDLWRFIARRGGIEPNGLGAAEVARRVRDGTPVRGHDLRNVSGLATQMAPGTGPVLRPGGRGLDEIGELLHEEGFFGPAETTPRPSEDDVLQLLAEVSRTGEKRYPLGGEPVAEFETAHDAYLRGEAEAERGAFAEAWAEDYAREWGEAPGQDSINEVAGYREHAPWVLDRAARLWRDGQSADAALEEALRIEYTSLSHAVAEDSSDDTYLPGFDELDDTSPGSDAQQAFLRWLDGYDDGAGGGGPTGEPGLAREGGGPGEGAAGDEGPPLADLTAEERAAFLDPNSDVAKAQADSLAHDARALQPDDPDALLRDLAFRLDEEGEPVNLADLLDELDADEAEIKTIRDCM